MSNNNSFSIKQSAVRVWPEADHPYFPDPDEPMPGFVEDGSFGYLQTTDEYYEKCFIDLNLDLVNAYDQVIVENSQISIDIFFDFVINYCPPSDYITNHSLTRYWPHEGKYFIENLELFKNIVDNCQKDLIARQEELDNLNS